MLSTEDIKQELARQTELYASGNFNSYFKYCSNDPKVLEGIFKEQKIRFTQPSLERALRHKEILGA